MKKICSTFSLLFLLGTEVASSQNIAQENMAAVTPCSPPAHITIATPHNPICQGDTAKLTAHGGLTYVWSTGATTSVIYVSPAMTSTYSVTGANSHGCSATASITLTVNPLPNVTITAENPICKGMKDSLKASGASSYKWHPTGDTAASIIVAPNTTTTYTVKATSAAGCSVTVTETVTVNPVPIINADTDLQHLITGGNLTATGGTPPYTYTVSPSISNIMMLPQVTTTFTITVTDANGCSSSDTATFIPNSKILGGCSELFISGYVQDTVNHDDAIEIYNPTAHAIHLKNYYLCGTTNASFLSPPFIIPLNGIIGANKTYIVTNPHADTALTHKAKLLSDSLNFGGRDLVALAKIVPTANTVQLTLLDIIGNINSPAPPHGWPAGMGSTKNFTLIRQSNVIMGELNWAVSQNEWIVYPQGTFNALKHYTNVCKRMDAQLILSTGNPNIICGNPSYYEFDIIAQADSSEKFNSCVVNIVYPLGEFAGDDASNIQVSPINPFLPNSDNDYGTLTLSNIAPDEIQISFGNPLDTSHNGVIVSPIPKPMLHVKLPIQGCQPGTILIDTVVSPPPPSSFTETSSNGHSMTVDYSSTSYTSNLNTTVCPMTMQHYNNPINAGTNAASVAAINSIPNNSSILTIDGYGFGNQKGTIQVSDADAGFDGKGHETLITLDSEDILIWSEYQIVVRMPSVLQNYSGTPGSGPFMIFNPCGETNTGAIQINYSIRNDISLHGPQKLRANIVMVNNNESFDWRCDSASFAGNPKAKGCVAKAIREWNCYTGVNWKLGADTLADTNLLDGISSIYFSNHLAVGTVMSTNNHQYLTCYDLNDSVEFTNEADIAINANITNWSYDTTGSSYSPDSTYFYDAILHEVGHGHRLGHINDTLSLMYWFTAAYRPTIISQGPYWPGPATLLAGLDVINTSVSPANSPSNLGCPLYNSLDTSKRGCLVAALNVPTILNSPYNLNIYPNPIHSGALTITYSLIKNSSVKFNIVDCTGRILVKFDDKNKSAGNHDEQINVNDLANGVYFFNATINGVSEIIKFIKI
jgi:hypothetical protein